MKVEVTSVESLPWITYEKCVLSFLCTMISLLANKRPPKSLPPLFCITIPKLVTCFLADMCRDIFRWGEGCLTIWPATSSNSFNVTDQKMSQNKTVNISLTTWPSFDQLSCNFRNIGGVAPPVPSNKHFSAS